MLNHFKLIFCLFLVVYPLAGTANDNNDALPIIVLDIELLGDTSVKSMQAGDEVLLAKFSKELRHKLSQNINYSILDDEQSLSIINKRAEEHFLHRCNGCEFVLAKELGAKQVIVPWVFRMSKLIQTMYVEIRDVETGSVVMHIGRNFRGNTEEGWLHVTNKLVEEINKYKPE